MVVWLERKYLRMMAARCRWTGKPIWVYWVSIEIWT